jgi:hypothetical protein
MKPAVGEQAGLAKGLGENPKSAKTLPFDVQRFAT